MSKLPFADKKLGQHFLRDKKIISRICSDFADDCQAIIEVGPGPGILTAGLCSTQKSLYLFEKDQRFLETLKEHTPEENIQMGDALEIDFETFCYEKNLNDIWLVSNLPYNVSVPLLLNFARASRIQKMTLMFQKEVAEKILNFLNNKNAMGSLMALSQNYFEVELLCKVSPGAFVPPPKVDSAVLSFNRIQNPIVPLDQFTKLEKFLRLTFSQKRKQLSKVLSTRFERDLVNKELVTLGLPETVRAEKLTLEQLINLFLRLH